MWQQLDTQLMHAFLDLWPLPVSVPATLEPLGAILVKTS
jgi:hypothetical protein